MVARSQETYAFTPALFSRAALFHIVWVLTSLVASGAAGHWLDPLPLTTSIGAFVASMALFCLVTIRRSSNICRNLGVVYPTFSIIVILFQLGRVAATIEVAGLTPALLVLAKTFMSTTFLIGYGLLHWLGEDLVHRLQNRVARR